jgi:hypothetical protein
MSIAFSCDCGRDLVAPEGEAGRRMLCHGCIELVRVPVPPDSQPSPEPPGPMSARDRIGLLLGLLWNLGGEARAGAGLSDVGRGSGRSG